MACEETTSALLENLKEKVPTCALMLSALHKLAELPECPGFRVNLVKGEEDGLDVKDHPIHKDLLFGMASLHHLQDLMDDFEADMLDLFSKVHTIALDPTALPDVDPSGDDLGGRIELASKIIKAAKTLHSLNLCLHNVMPYDGGCTRMLLANRFDSLQWLQCVSGDFYIDDLLTALGRARNLRQLILLGPNIHDLRRGWQDLVAMLDSLRSLKCIDFDVLRDGIDILAFNYKDMRPHELNLRPQSEVKAGLLWLREHSLVEAEQHD
ncbi:hypothetical protein LTR95_011447 [Oleoguttula sp. CCFEE 5521]